MNAGPEILSFDGISKTFTDSQYRLVPALKEITFSLARGEILSIVGPSGCGKTTLLRLAAGLGTATSGTLRFEGQPVGGPSKERGLVFQAYNSFPWLSVRRNVSFGLQNPAQHADAVNSWITTMGLTAFSDAFPKVLSGGMRQRLAIARAMIVKPKLLLLDEPFGALDEHTREAMQTMLSNIASKDNLSVLIVTHDIREAILLSDRIVVLSARPGRVVKIVQSNLSRPRERAILATKEFGMLYEALRESERE